VLSCGDKFLSNGEVICLGDGVVSTLGAEEETSGTEVSVVDFLPRLKRLKAMV
jgi:hypothetical protein